ncbi:ATP-binding protein [bacterium]|nr:ATP-binding protein [bacterium]
MISEISISRYKKIGRSPVELTNLSRVNYLVGENNAGKSSVLEAVLLSSLGPDMVKEQPASGGIPDQFAQQKEYFHNELLDDPIEARFDDVLVSWNGESFVRSKAQGSIPKVLYIPCSVNITIRDSLGNMAWASLQSTIQTTGILPVGNVASWIYHAERKQLGTGWTSQESREFKLLKRTVRKHFGISLARPEVNDQNQIVFQYKEGAKLRNLYLLGSGAQNVVYIVAALVYAKDYPLILIDEPELHLHPGMQKELGRLLGKLATELDKQIIISTQSPFLVSASDNNRIFIIERGKIVQDTTASTPVAISMALGSHPRDIGAPHNFVILEEASMQDFLENVNKRFYKKNLVFIAAVGYNDVPNKEEVYRKIINHDVILKCTPFYSDEYFVVVDRQIPLRDKNIKAIKGRLGSKRFLMLSKGNLERKYPGTYVTSFSRNKLQGGDVGKWLDDVEYPERGERKYKLAHHVAKEISQSDFESYFRELMPIFE